MKPVQVKKAYLPTIDEARGVSLDDIQSLRWIPERHRKTFAQPVSVSRSTKEGTGQTIPYEIGVARKEHGVPLPGLLSADLESINPRRDVAGTWVGPSNTDTLTHPDFTFNPMQEAGILLGITESPNWWRTLTQGANTPAGEGFQYGGFPKESFVEIPRPNNANPFQISYAAKYKDNSPQELLDFLNQFPQEQGTNRWGQIMGAPLTEQELIDQNLITPLSYEQRIVDSPFLPRKVTSEPMDIAFQLLKERVSPEAKRHKLEYDKKYESSPERVKYREELNRERRRRGIYGSHDHKDISHTEGGKLTLEGEHENRARHFKDRGTLRELNKAQQTLPSYDKSQVESLVKPDQSTMYISSRPGREKVSAEEQSQKHDALLAAIAELNKNKQMNIMTGVGEGEWGKEHSIAIQNYSPEIKEKLYALARQFGQDAVAESNAREKGMRFVNPATREDTFSFGGREIQEEPRYSTNFPTGQKITFTE